MISYAKSEFFVLKMVISSINFYFMDHYAKYIMHLLGEYLREIIAFAMTLIEKHPEMHPVSHPGIRQLLWELADTIFLCNSRHN